MAAASHVSFHTASDGKRYAHNGLHDIRHDIKSLNREFPPGTAKLLVSKVPEAAFDTSDWARMRSPPPLLTVKLQVRAILDRGDTAVAHAVADALERMWNLAKENHTPFMLLVKIDDVPAFDELIGYLGKIDELAESVAIIVTRVMQLLSISAHYVVASAFLTVDSNGSMLLEILQKVLSGQRKDRRKFFTDLVSAYSWLGTMWAKDNTNYPLSTEAADADATAREEHDVSMLFAVFDFACSRECAERLRVYERQCLENGWTLRETKHAETLRRDRETRIEEGRRAAMASTTTLPFLRLG
jgi:hypothetical protein